MARRPRGGTQDYFREHAVETNGDAQDALGPEDGVSELEDIKVICEEVQRFSVSWKRSKRAQT